MTQRLVLSRFGALMWLVSGAWLLLIRFRFWGAGYAQWGELGATLPVLAGIAALTLGALFWLRFRRALQRGWLLAAAILGTWVAGRLLSGGFEWPDYGLVALLLLTGVASFRTRTIARAKRKVSPLDYPVFG